MSDEHYTALVRAVLGYAGLKMAYTLKGVSVDEGAMLDTALECCKPEGYDKRRTP